MSTTTDAPTAAITEIQALGAELTARDSWTRGQVDALRRERTRALIAHALAASPYYRDALGADAMDAPLETLPTLSKAVLMAEFDRIVTDPRLRLADLERHLTGAQAPGLYRGAYHVFATSGSSGLHGITVFTDQEFRCWIAACMRMFARIGLGPGARVAAIGAPGQQHITRRLFAAFRSGRPGAPRLTVSTPLAEIVAAVERYQPEAIIGYPTIAALLADEQFQGRLRIAPRIVLVGSEPLTDEMRERIMQAWGVPATEVYAATEAPIIACGTSDHPGLSICDDLVRIEIVDRENRPVPAGTPGHKVLLTNLVNHAQPLIRYELTDSVTMAAGPHPAGLPWQRIAAVDGRSDDIVQLPAAGGGTMAVHPHRLRAPFATLPDVRMYQVVYDGSGVTVRVVLRDHAPRDVGELVRRRLIAALEEAGAVPPPVTVEKVADLAREPGPAGKLKLVKIAPG